MIQKTTNILVSVLIVCVCLLACNTEKFRPKPKESVPSAVQKEEPKPKSAAEEAADEEIGPASLNYEDVDESGDGIYGRQISPSFYEKLAVIKQEADPNLKGTLKIVACINQLGAVVLARPEISQTTMNDMALQRKVGKILIDERFDPSPGAPDRQCGHVIVEF